MASRLLLGFVLTLSAACGTNRPTVPGYLLEDDAGTGADTGPGGYPAGPYCTNVDQCVEGATIENFTFPDGWLNPAEAQYDLTKLGPISFGDFYDATGAKTELLMINTAAFWCAACVVEHGGTDKIPSLNERVDQFGPRGFALFSLIFQDAKSEPATKEDLQAWAQTFETRFPMARDPDYEMGRYAASQSAPLNLIIDARTMVILRKFLGDQTAVIWPYIDSELSARGK